MANNKKPRKAYKPRRKVTNLIGYMSALSPGETSELLVSYQMSLGAILQGTGTVQDCNMLTEAINTCAVLCLQHDWPEHYDTAVKGQQAQAAMNNRVREGKPAVYTGLEMAAVRDAIQIYDVQILLMTPRNIANALKVVKHELVKQNFTKPA